jgi:hypothetical protein
VTKIQVYSCFYDENLAHKADITINWAIATEGSAVNETCLSLQLGTGAKFGLQLAKSGTASIYPRGTNHMLARFHQASFALPISDNKEKLFFDADKESVSCSHTGRYDFLTQDEV